MYTTNSAGYPGCKHIVTDADGKKDFSEIIEKAKTCKPPVEIEKEMNAMEEQGIISGYTPLINWDKTGCEHVTALIEVTVAPERGRGFDKVAERIYQFDEVESLYLMSGSGFDLTVIIVGKTMKEVAWFVATKLAPMESVMSTATHFVLKKYKEHGLSLIAEERGDERQLITP